MHRSDSLPRSTNGTTQNFTLHDNPGEAPADRQSSLASVTAQRTIEALGRPSTAGHADHAVWYR